ncbi:transferase hexapeptide repeat containing protein [Tychonema sp. BBK16]|uniref:transferase hexapeptide repeat containing protein n=1 Tax=Tychonema sp. BBK16 TaxID=2699888 RepID=UPI0038D31F7C
MLDEAILEHRLSIIEQEVANLKRNSESNSLSGNWLDKLIGSISDQSAFLEALEYGRAFRQADKPNDEGYEQA